MHPKNLSLDKDRYVEIHWYWGNNSGTTIVLPHAIEYRQHEGREQWVLVCTEVSSNTMKRIPMGSIDEWVQAS
jgi:hypothetical protein